jgi:hypothetical protein
MLSRGMVVWRQKECQDPGVIPENPTERQRLDGIHRPAIQTDYPALLCDSSKYGAGGLITQCEVLSTVPPGQTGSRTAKSVYFRSKSATRLPYANGSFSSKLSWPSRLIHPYQFPKPESHARCAFEGSACSCFESLRPTCNPMRSLEHFESRDVFRNLGLASLPR